MPIQIARSVIACVFALSAADFGSPHCHAQDPATVTAPLPVELQPYNVRISISFAKDPQFSTRYRSDSCASVGHVTRRLVGQMWNLEVIQNRWLLPASADGIKRLAVADLQNRYDGAPFDKVYLITVEAVGAQLHVSGCEWDPSANSLGAIIHRQLFERRSLATEIVSLVEELFRPTVALDQAGAETVRVRIKAGEYLPADSHTQRNGFRVKPGDILWPYFRYLDQHRVARRIQLLPWTYLVVNSVSRADAECRVHTGLRSPLSGKSRRRVEALALGIRPQFSSTRLRLSTHAGKALVGYQVHVFSQRPKASAEPTTDSIAEYLSDRRGLIRIPVDGRQPLVWVEVRSGNSLLAQVPFVPGGESASSMSLPNDALRLQVEGQLEILRGKLIDTVARRSMYIALAHRFAKSAEWQRVDEVFEKLDELPGFQVYQAQLTQIRYPALQTATRRKDRLAEGRIQRLCRQTLEVIQRHLDDAKVKELKEEMQQLRDLDVDAKPAAKDAKPAVKNG